MTRSILLLVIVAAVSVALWLLGGDASRPPFASQKSPNPLADLTLLRQAPRPRLVANGIQEIEKKCLEFWNEVRDLDLRQLMEFPPRLHRFPEGARCRSEAVPTELTSYHQDFLKVCAGFNPAEADGMNKNSWRARQSQCFLVTMAYRAALSEWATREVPLDSISDPLVLSDKLVIALQRGKLDRSVEISDRILSVDSQSYLAAEARMIALALKAVNEGKEDSEHTCWDRAEKAIAIAHRNNVSQASEPLKAQLFVDYMRYRDSKRLEKLALAARAENPHSLEPARFLALARYQQGQVQDALELLKYLRENGDEEAAEIEKRLLAGAPNPFVLGLSSSFVGYSE